MPCVLGVEEKCPDKSRQFLKFLLCKLVGPQQGKGGGMLVNANFY